MDAGQDQAIAALLFRVVRTLDPKFARRVSKLPRSAFKGSEAILLSKRRFFDRKLGALTPLKRRITRAERNGGFHSLELSYSLKVTKSGEEIESPLNRDSAWLIPGDYDPDAPKGELCESYEADHPPTVGGLGVLGVNDMDDSETPIFLPFSREEQQARLEENVLYEQAQAAMLAGDLPAFQSLLDQGLSPLQTPASLQPQTGEAIRNDHNKRGAPSILATILWSKKNRMPFFGLVLKQQEKPEELLRSWGLLRQMTGSVESIDLIERITKTPLQLRQGDFDFNSLFPYEWERGAFYQIFHPLGEADPTEAIVSALLRTKSDPRKLDPVSWAKAVQKHAQEAGAWSVARRRWPPDPLLLSGQMWMAVPGSKSACYEAWPGREFSWQEGRCYVHRSRACFAGKAASCGWENWTGKLCCLRTPDKGMCELVSDELCAARGWIPTGQVCCPHVGFRETRPLRDSECLASGGLALKGGCWRPWKLPHSMALPGALSCVPAKKEACQAQKKAALGFYWTGAECCFAPDWMEVPGSRERCDRGFRLNSRGYRAGYLGGACRLKLEDDQSLKAKPLSCLPETEARCRRWAGFYTGERCCLPLE